MQLTEWTGLKKLLNLLLDREFYKQRGHAVLACLAVLYLTAAYIVGFNVNISIFSDLTVAAGLLIILPKIKLNGVETSNKLARNIFGYTFLTVVIFVALGKRSIPYTVTFVNLGVFGYGYLLFMVNF